MAIIVAAGGCIVFMKLRQIRLRGSREDAAGEGGNSTAGKKKNNLQLISIRENNLRLDIYKNLNDINYFYKLDKINYS